MDWLTQPLATVIGAAFAVCAAVIAFMAASKQASAVLAAAQAQVEGSLRLKALEAKNTMEIADAERKLLHTAIRRQVVAYTYTVISAAAQLFVVNPFPADRKSVIDCVQRLLDRLTSLDTVEALDFQEAAKALNEIAYIQTSLYRLRRRWDTEDRSAASLERLRVNAYRLFTGSERVAKALETEASDALLYVERMRSAHAPLIARLAPEAAISRTQIRIDN